MLLQKTENYTFPTNLGQYKHEMVHVIRQDCFGPKIIMKKSPGEYANMADNYSGKGQSNQIIT